MDAGLWLNSLGLGGVLVLAVYTANAAVLGGAVASLGRVPIWLGVALGVLVPFLGILGLLVAALVRLRSTPPAIARAPVATTTSAVAAPVSIWADPTAMQWPSLPAVPAVTISLPVGLTPVPQRSARVFSRGGMVSTGLLLLVLVGAAMSLFLRWFRFDSQVIPPLDVWAWGTGIDAAVLVTIALLAVAVALAALRPSRWAAVIATTVGAWWALLGGAALLLAAPLTATLGSLGALSYSIGDALTALGVDADTATIPLPAGVDLSSLGIVGSSIDAGTIDLAAPIPAATLEVGAALPVIFAVGVLALVWAVVELAAAHRFRRRLRAGSTAPSATSGT